MKRSRFTAILAVVMAVIMGTLVSVNAFAASATKYISEIVISTSSSSLSAATRALTQKGYTPVSYDLNKSNSGYVAIGVKTTTDKSKAITDVAIMNMNGGYSFGDYENLLKQQEETAGEIVENIMAAVEEYKANVAAGKPKALLAQRMLDTYTDEDFDNRGLGDILANETLTKEQLTVIFLQASSLALTGIESYLALACATNWLDDFVNYDTTGTYTAEDYNYAEILLTAIKPLRQTLLDYDSIFKASNLDMNTATEEQWETYYESLSDTDKQTVDNYSSLYNAFKSTSYKGGTLYDFFTQDLDQITDTDLLPFVKVLTPGQLATFPYATAAASFQYALMTDDTAQDLVDMEEGNLETHSIFEGVDRSIFEADGIALTTAAMQEAASTNDTSMFRGNLSETEEKAFYALIGVAGGIAAISGAIWAYASSQVSAIFTAAYAEGFASVGFIDAEIIVQSTVNEVAVLGGQAATTEELCTTIDYIGVEAARSSAMSTASNSVWAHVAGVTKVITGIAIAVVLILVTIYLVREYKAYLAKFNDVEYTRIPRVIVNETVTSDNSTKYSNYYAAKSISEDSAKDTGYGDLNNWAGSQWLAVYYTTDTSAGSPITSKVTVSYDKTTSSADYPFAVHVFGSKAAYNLNTFSKGSSKIYMYFGTDSGTLAATTMNYGYYAITAVAGLLIGGIGSYLIFGRKGKKKSGEEQKTKEKETETE